MTKVRIYYHNTDCGGVVYYGEYMKFLEEARTDFFEERGLFIKDLMTAGIGFVVARQEIDYKYPAVYGDTLEIKTWVGKISKASMEFGYETRNQDGKLINLAKTVLVFVDKSFKPRAIPDEVREKIGTI